MREVLKLGQRRRFGALPADVTVHKGETLFPRLDMEKALAELEKMNAPAAPQFAPIEPEVTIDDFQSAICVCARSSPARP